MFIVYTINLGSLILLNVVLLLAWEYYWKPALLSHAYELKSQVPFTKIPQSAIKRKKYIRIGRYEYSEEELENFDE